MDGFIKWRDEWLLGVATLDDQHKILAECLNRLVRACSCRDETGKLNDQQRSELLRTLLNELYEKTKEHFDNEGRLMRDEGYPDYASHAREHVMLLAELKSTFADRLNKECCSMNADILKALKFWLIAHIARSDREFANYLHNKRAREAERQDLEARFKP
jgi:hemerythrin